MSLQRLSPLLALTNTAGRSFLPPVASSTADRLQTSLRGVAFWSAILLPLTYLPLLFGDGMSVFGVASADLELVLLLIALNVVAFAIGHTYNQPADA